MAPSVSCHAAPKPDAERQTAAVNHDSDHGRREVLMFKEVMLANYVGNLPQKVQVSSNIGMNI